MTLDTLGQRQPCFECVKRIAEEIDLVGGAQTISAV